MEIHFYTQLYTVDHKCEENTEKEIGGRKRERYYLDHTLETVMLHPKSMPCEIFNFKNSQHTQNTLHNHILCIKVY